MGRASWASSAKFHDKFGDKGEKNMEQVLSDYGIDSPEAIPERPLVIIDRDQHTAAVAALVDLVEEHPEALALVIKHYAKDFKKLYDAEVDRRR